MVIKWGRRSLGIDWFTLNRFLPIPILTDFENFNLTDTDTDFQIWTTYRYRFFPPKNNIPIPIPMLYILPIFTDTNFPKLSERSVQYLAQAGFKLKIGVSLARLSEFLITRSDKYQYKKATFYRYRFLHLNNIPIPNFPNIPIDRYRLSVFP